MLLLGLNPLTSLYVAVALTFSSTIMVVKLLSDKREIDSLHGRIALGFLIVQDIFVVLCMVVVSALAAGAGQASALAGVGRVILGGGAMLVFVAVVIRYVAEPLTARLARAPELLAGFAIGWAALLAAVGDAVGIGKEIGGLLAGVSLASTQFREAIAARLSSLRDFLLLFFFIALGARLDLGAMGEQLGAAAVLSLFVLVGHPLIVVAIMGAMGYRRRSGLLAGLAAAQIRLVHFRQHRSRRGNAERDRAARANILLEELDRSYTPGSLALMALTRAPMVTALDGHDCSAAPRNGMRRLYNSAHLVRRSYTGGRAEAPDEIS
jgi:Kef-type K+ transport system membrane component KefB